MKETELLATLVTFLLMWRNIMTKVTYRRKYLFGSRGITDSSLVVGIANWVHASGTKNMKQWHHTRNGMSLYSLKAHPNDVLPPTRPCLLNLPNSVISWDNWFKCIQMSNTMGDINHSNHHRCWMRVLFACLFVLLKK